MRKGTLATLWLTGSCLLGPAGSAAELEVKPGPTQMTASEAAIVADVTKGVEHGVILIDETDSNDNTGMPRTAYHMRAKILSQAGRGLADITIPVNRPSDLKTWWGRTIFPDGRVVDFPESELKSQSVHKSSSGEYHELKAALPGVVPGCVIDFGWVVERNGLFSSNRVFIQREWPVRSFRYRWTPSSYEPNAYILSRAEGLTVDTKLDGRSVTITARDLDPVPEEPDMPPLDEARASATFYYTTTNKVEDYWDQAAKNLEATLKMFLGGAGALRGTLDTMAIPAAAPLAEKLRLAYEWLGANVKNTTRLSAEEEQRRDVGDDDAVTAKSVLKAKEANSVQLNFLFAGFARTLGADARIVRAADRTDHFWKKALKSTRQFNYTFVAVRAPGAPDDDLVFVDAGSGLPYGQVPWRATGSRALACSSKGSSFVFIPPALPKDNRSDVLASMSFSEDNESMLVKWSRTANGAEGWDYRQWLRRLEPRQRKETLDTLCAGMGQAEVTAAELPGLDQTSGPFRIVCETESTELILGESVSTYALYVAGPWSPEPPQFTAATRVHPVVFDFPGLEIVALDITAPHGFKPVEAPAPVTLDSPYGKYQLVVTTTPTGYHVDRAWALTVLTAKPEEYQALRKFFDAVRNADSTMVTFAREGAAR